MRIFTHIWGYIVGVSFFVGTLLAAIGLVTLAIFVKKKSFFYTYIRNIWVKPLLKMAGVEVEIRGAEKLQSKDGGLCVFNHSSNYDILIMFLLKKQITFGAKAELFKVPFLAQGMRKIDILPIYRKNRKKVFEIYKQATHRMSQGEYFALAPEGTRVKSTVIGSFKNGPFIFAAQAKANVYPVVIAGAQRVQPTGTIKVYVGHKVIVEVLEPVSAADYNPDDVSELRDRVYTKMKAHHEKLRAELNL